MAEHTPGPWFAERTRLDGHEWFIRSKARNLPPYNWHARFAAKIDPLIPVSGKYVDARSGKTPDDGCCPIATSENEANARLVAAAPDMLEYIRSSASAGCATAESLLRAHSLALVGRQR